MSHHQLDSVIILVLYLQLILSLVIRNPILCTMIMLVNSVGMQITSIMSNYLSCIDWYGVLYVNPSAADGWNVFMSLLWHTINMYVPTYYSRSTLKTVM